VVDLYRNRPVDGASVSFSPTLLVDEKAFQGRTDAKGRFRIEAPPREGKAYFAIISHPDYRSNSPIDSKGRDWGALSWNSRVSAGRQAVLMSPDYKGELGKPVQYNFALVPTNLSPQEYAKERAVP
jgi:hypothetical protein